ncbi:YtxH domain-containing protein, partial [Escherichia coli]|uniref:YtxH domain-containing protein n=1 Tax=Escherichia coli TaxID=562 RepID=UPI003CF5A02C
MSFMSFIKGAIVGAGAALLFAPKSGKETREDLRKKYEESKDTANEYAVLAREKGQ